MTIQRYVSEHTARGECQCTQCREPDELLPKPTDHVADLIFFTVTMHAHRDKPATAEEFVRLTQEQRGEFGPVDPLDGSEHSYIELGGWIGDQGLAMQYMGLGVLLGVFELLTPRTMIAGIDVVDPGAAMEMAQAGFVAIRKKLEEVAHSEHLVATDVAAGPA